MNRAATRKTVCAFHIRFGAESLELEPARCMVSVRSICEHHSGSVKLVCGLDAAGWSMIIDGYMFLQREYVSDVLSSSWARKGVAARMYWAYLSVLYSDEKLCPRHWLALQYDSWLIGHLTSSQLSVFEKSLITMKTLLYVIS